MVIAGFALAPPEASTFAGPVDAITLSLLGLCGLIAFVVFSLIVGFGILYRSGSTRSREIRKSGQLALEWSWTIATMAVFIVLFTWAAALYFRMHAPPPNVSEITVVGKQWMWKFQHADGRQELGEVHVSVGQPVLLTMTSQDVIHSFSVPAFRIKQDLLPGRYTQTWFEATRVGTYPLFCTQYCGTEHAAMQGQVVVLSPQDYERWLQSGIAHASAQGVATRIEQGHRLYQRFGCVHCHDPGSAVAAPNLRGIYGKKVDLTDGTSVIADDNYLRESIVSPSVKIVAGYTDLMPPFSGQASEEDILNLIAFIQSLSAPNSGVTKP